MPKQTNSILGTIAGLYLAFSQSNTYAKQQITPKILVLGDSQYAGVYGHELDHLLKQAGNTIKSYGCVSATAQDYIQGGKHCVLSKKGSTRNSIHKDYILRPIKYYLTTFAPNAVIISLGGNIQANSNSKKNRTQQISKLVQIVTSQNIKCIWIGPPGKEDPAEKETRDIFYNHLKEGLENKCTLIDSRDYAIFKKHELHFKDTQRPKQWAQAIYTKLTREILSEIILQMPPKIHLEKPLTKNP